MTNHEECVDARFAMTRREPVMSTPDVFLRALVQGRKALQQLDSKQPPLDSDGISAEDHNECKLLAIVMAVYRQQGKLVRTDLGDISQLSVADEVIDFWIAMYPGFAEDVMQVPTSR